MFSLSNQNEYSNIPDRNNTFKIFVEGISKWSEFFSIDIGLQNISGGIIEKDSYQIDGGYYVSSNGKQLTPNETSWKSENILPNLYIEQNFSFSGKLPSRKDILIILITINGIREVMGCRVGAPGVKFW